MNRSVFKILAFSLLFVACAPQHGPAGLGGSRGGVAGTGINKQQIGTVVGALGGAYLGENVGGGKGKTLGIAAGTMLGSMVGGQIGASLDRADRGYFENTAQASLDHNAAGTTSRWLNPNTGNSGTITPTRHYQRNDGSFCREFTQTISIAGEDQEAYGTACRDANGVWRIVK